MLESAIFQPNAHNVTWTGSESVDERVMEALLNQSAIIQEDEDGELELYYYRFSGSTAIQPGINRIGLRLRRTRDDPACLLDSSAIFDAEGMPQSHVREPLFEAFYAHLSSQFPAISRRRMLERFASCTMSQFLANAISALGARMSQRIESNVFTAKACSFVLPYTQLPTTEAVSALMLLAWACYGEGNESGFWQFTGMAIRIGLDIGLHQDSEIYDSPANLRRAHLLFWTLFATDRLISFGTGRPASIAEELVEIRLPIDMDLYPIAARDTEQHEDEPVQPVPFVYYVRLMVIVGRISNLLNGRRGKPRTLATASDSLSIADRLTELQSILIQFFSTLPEPLRWTPSNFRLQVDRGHGGMFLALHLWAHAVLALTYHPDLLKSPSGTETPLTAGMNRNIKLAMSSAKQIAECVVFADLVSEASYTSAPQLVQPIFVACMALIYEMRAEITPEEDSIGLYFRSLARENYSTLIKALCRMAAKWQAALSVIDLLEKRSGIPRPSDAPSGPIFISAPDTGMLRRFTADKDHPLNIAPPTDSSLQESIERTGAALPLSNLLAGYSVGDTSYAPVGLEELGDLIRD